MFADTFQAIELTIDGKAVNYYPMTEIERAKSEARALQNAGLGTIKLTRKTITTRYFEDEADAEVEAERRAS